MDIHVYFHNNDEKLDRILRLLVKMDEREIAMAGELADLQAKVAAAATVEDSAVALLQGLKAALDAAGTDPAALAALSASIDTETQKLAAAVVANTPAAPPAA